MGVNANPLGFSEVSTILEEQYRAKRNEENLAPAEVSRLVKVITNLGFPKPVATIGNGSGSVSLQLADYLSRGARPDVPVEVLISWPDMADPQNAAAIVNRFKVGIWEGFEAVAAILYPGKETGVLRELAFTQIPNLDKVFSAELARIASQGL